MRNGMRMIPVDDWTKFYDKESSKLSGFAYDEGYEDALDQTDNFISSYPAVIVVEAAQIEKAKRELLQRLDEFIASYKEMSQYPHDHFEAKADAMDIAKHFVTSTFESLCSSGTDKTNV